jgi:uncharacterized protein YkwD
MIFVHIGRLEMGGLAVNGRRLAVAGLVAAALWWSGPAGAASLSAPVLRASARKDGRVQLRWTCKATQGVKLQAANLERSHDGGAFAAIPGPSKAKPRQSWTDRPDGGGTWGYRVRMVTDAGTSEWSSPASVTIQNASGGGTNTLSECPAGEVEQVLALVNDARKGAGLSALQNDTRLASAARTHTIVMAGTQQLTHTNWVAYIRAAGYPGGWLGENIAYGYQSAAAVVKGWLQSSGHRANILGSQYRDSGVGCIVDGRGRLWWTQDFGG